METAMLLNDRRLLCWGLLLLLGTTVTAANAQEGEVESAAEKKIEKPAALKKVSLFDGKDLRGWKIIEKFDFERHGKVQVKDGAIVLGVGAPASGIAIDPKIHNFPRSNYEMTLEAKRTQGDDFFCGITFPVDKAYCTLVLGGWGGGTVGLSNIDNAAADENETTNYINFKKDKWYKIRLRVTDKAINVWVDKEHLIELDRKKHKFSIWWEQEPVRPFGFASWYTAAAYRNIQLQRLKKEAN
ncbi:MAG: DUF1080 domain-containing protein [Pirellulaceae bacterium]|nr:DUF1080 domain-containing protein [Planctomycetaceae bacterium]